MGIRYCAYPITRDEYPRALATPSLFLSQDPLMDAWGPQDLRSEVLYLDKCWSYLQTLFSPLPGELPRPAFHLVVGQVTHTRTGWISYQRALSPDEVDRVATDLAQFDDATISARLTGIDMFNEPSDRKVAYVAQYLSSAREYTARLAEDGRGLVYMIG
ncbi:DUF1877 family protein [Cryobacterium tepidiphilum]|uniref:DUF1877 family protein n=1 Tax=Cryobacterium tepidiphilum TaxID=2486026 RepID=A0A3M8LE98_9MICO|nr:DUF1877 family protein [Cryobacterium tepidiphilum]RNE63806.1 DUF1877 family protein [Cryobacterium tepidiphilum]